MGPWTSDARPTPPLPLPQVRAITEVPTTRDNPNTPIQVTSITVNQPSA